MDQDFLAYPLRELAAAALQAARDRGAGHADFRAERIRGQQVRLSDGKLETLADSDDIGLAVRVVVDGTWGFAATVDLTPEAAAHAAAAAVTVARTAAPLAAERIELATEPAWGEVTWVSDYETDPFTVPTADKIELLASWSAGLMAAAGVDHVDASLDQVRECKFYCDGATTAIQQRVRVHPELTTVAVEPGGRFETMRTLAPRGRGFEYLTGTGDFAAELAELPAKLAGSWPRRASGGRYDPVIDPSNLFLTIHESVGHATELDRALGLRAPRSLPWTSSERCSTARRDVTGDRTVAGLATVGWDDEGVRAQSWDLITGGAPVGYQLDRRMARMAYRWSNGCAYADSPATCPSSGWRMCPCSLRRTAWTPPADRRGHRRHLHRRRQELVDRHARYNFQFTGQRPYRSPRAAGLPVARRGYQATTTDF
jgi:TldD protein